MSAYRGRTGPNLSDFMSNLNHLSPQDETFPTVEFDDNDLAMFTNTDFTSLDMNMPDDSFNYNINDPQFGSVPVHTSPADTPQYYPNFNTPIQPSPPQFTPAPNTARPTPAPQSGSGVKSSSADTRSVVSPEDSSRVAAEEDKRRRNTAASARFRVKKKQREQALEKSVKEVNDQNSKLQARLDQLEMENKWLKDLITEKNGGAIQSREDIDEAFQQYKRESEERQDVKEEAPRVKGVGTK
ncbi:Regulatory protein cys-3 [Cyphellophora attinorum]|uniref:Regulatory protein cys-3 n=1 Tax=Cyphellophora attinorum TaxID=1664694 RepID=A0A0N1HYA0_9EURO|nr:Regulatory protein cys-3 [Phialophora attinorum]KPI43303.1 Regulatory protein cys-3 [Phialophora attinorum]